jgi:hypothetical protein
MTDVTKEFCERGAPFRALRRFSTEVAMAGYVVRSRIGEDVALCDDPDTAAILAEALNLRAVRARVACPNCKESTVECACMRNKCLRCGGSVGNITFTVCDKCWGEPVAAGHRAVREKVMSDTPENPRPYRRLRLEIVMHADDQDTLLRELQEVVSQIECGQVGPVISGGCDSSFHFVLIENKEMTPELYREQLTRYLDAKRSEEAK